MPIHVLIVDDSRFICKRIQQILEEEPGFKIVGVAVNGKQAVQMATKYKPDVITMDVEMPVMDGITAVKIIMAECPTAILMFSATTHAGAQATLDALNAGAIDFLPKQLDEIDGNREMAKRLLRRRVRIVALQAKTVQIKSFSGLAKTGGTDVLNPVPTVTNRQNRPSFQHSKTRKTDLLVIVASTGGPVAIQKVLSQLSPNCSFPILIVQHMPQNFTASFADRLNLLCRIKVTEAENGNELKPGQALLAPGGMQMELKGRTGRNSVLIREKKTGEIYSPCADITLSSIADIFSANVLAVVLTGMGSDGKEGAIKLKQNGASIWAQNEASSIIYGMPKAIVDANLADKVLSLDEIAKQFKTLN